MKNLFVILSLLFFFSSCTKQIDVPGEISIKRSSSFHDVLKNANNVKIKGKLSTTDNYYNFEFADTFPLKKVEILKGMAVEFKVDVDIDTLKGTSDELKISPKRIHSFYFNFSKPIKVVTKEGFAVKVNRISSKIYKDDKLSVEYRFQLAKTLTVLLCDLIGKQNTSIVKESTNDTAYGIPDIFIENFQLNFRKNSVFKIGNNNLVLGNESSVAFKGFSLTKNDETHGGIVINLKLGNGTSISSADLTTKINDGILKIKGDFLATKDIFKITSKGTDSGLFMNNSLFENKRDEGVDGNLRISASKMNINFFDFVYEKSNILNLQSLRGKVTLTSNIDYIESKSMSAFVKSKKFQIAGLSIQFNQDNETFSIDSKPISFGLERLNFKTSSQYEVECRDVNVSISGAKVEKWRDLYIDLASLSNIESNYLSIKNGDYLFTFEKGFKLETNLVNGLRLLPTGEAIINSLQVSGRVDRVKIQDVIKKDSIVLSKIEADFNFDSNRNLTGTVSLRSEQSSLNGIEVKSLVEATTVTIEKMEIKSSPFFLKVSVPKMTIAIDKNVLLTEVQNIIPPEIVFDNISIHGKDLYTYFTVGIIKDFRIRPMVYNVQIPTLSIKNNRAYYNINSKLRLTLQADVLRMEIGWCGFFPCPKFRHEWKDGPSITLTPKLEGSVGVTIDKKGERLSNVSILYSTECNHVDIENFPGWVENIGEIENRMCKITQKSGSKAIIKGLSKAKVDLLSKFTLNEFNINSDNKNLVIDLSLDYID